MGNKLILNSLSPMEAALTYEKIGFSVIPVKFDKKPFIKWESYQKERPTPEQIKSWWTHWPQANIGIVTGAISGVVVIDVDKPDEGMRALSEYLTNSRVPTATTPRGGYHLYFKAPEKPLSNKAGTPQGCDFRGEGGYIVCPPSTNGAGKGYQWINGLSLDEVAPPAMPNTLINSLINAFKKGGGKNKTSEEDHTNPHEPTRTHKMFEYGVRDNSLFHTTNCLVKGGMPKEEISQVLEAIMNSWGEGYDQKWRDDKIQSALKRAERRERNIAQEVRDWVNEPTSGHFESTLTRFDLHLSTKEDLRAMSAALSRLVAEGVIERYGDKRGAYRRIEKQCEEIDFLNASSQTIDIKWPLGIERYIITLPKNVMVVAGSKDSGKTAFLLNFVQLNMNRFFIHYFSSEMGRIEFRKRLEKFGFPLEAWKFNPKERSSNFADVIEPDGINIIDYLEISEDFYRVGGMLAEIYKKLNQGIAIVALQKNRGRDTGIGGERSLEKPRLYLSLESGKAKIIVGKNWASEDNPVGLQLDFKLAQGCKFVIQKDWYRP